jgi:hypothetical protein
MEEQMLNKDITILDFLNKMTESKIQPKSKVNESLLEDEVFVFAIFIKGFHPHWCAVESNSNKCSNSMEGIPQLVRVEHRPST